MLSIKLRTHSAWVRARKEANLPQVRVHDLKHTFGRRLRAAGVSFEDRQDLLGHRAGRMTTHYSAAELSDLIEAAGKVCDREGAGKPELVGDGVMVVRDGTDEWSWMFWPQRGEYANTTYFLTDVIHCPQFEVFSGIVTDIALSDGLEPLALNYADKTVHDPFFTGMFEPLVKAEGCGEITTLSASLEQFLSSERVRSRTDDDVSLILATSRNHAQSQ